MALGREGAQGGPQIPGGEQAAGDPRCLGIGLRDTTAEVGADEVLSGRIGPGK